MDCETDCFCQEKGQSAPVENTPPLVQDAAPQNAPDNAGRLVAPGQGGNVSTTPPQSTTGHATTTAPMDGQNAALLRGERLAVAITEIALLPLSKNERADLVRRLLRE